MNRKEFLILCAKLGIALPILPQALAGCSKDELTFEPFDVNFSGKVLVIGAGAAGITAAYLLDRYGIEFELIEASDTYGGRIKGNYDLADFPIDMGAEWIHTDPSILSEITSDANLTESVDIINYNPKELKVWRDGKLRQRNFYMSFYAEHKFKDSGWFDFYSRFLVPRVQDGLRLNNPVSAVDYSGSKVQVTTRAGQIFEGDKVLMTVPLTSYHKRMISFNPDLSSDIWNAYDDTPMPDGLKIFFRFSEKFYPDIIVNESIASFLGSESGDYMFYDAAFGKETNDHVLGLFTVGGAATEYVSITDQEALVAKVMAELDAMYDGLPSRVLLDYDVQNWSAEEFIGGSYTHDTNNSRQAKLKAPLSGKVYFAGETYADDWATVHGAAMSAYEAVEEMLKG